MYNTSIPESNDNVRCFSGSTQTTAARAVPNNESPGNDVDIISLNLQKQIAINTL
jgi:hypothetical protein